MSLNNVGSASNILPHCGSLLYYMEVSERGSEFCHQRNISKDSPFPKAGLSPIEENLVLTW